MTTSLPIFEHLRCEEGTHCQACRDASPTGQAWRENLLSFYPSPDGLRDFACPLGKPWHSGTATAEPAPAPPLRSPQRPRPSTPHANPRDTQRRHRISLMQAAKRLGLGGWAWLKLALRIGLAEDHIAQARLKVCQSCPSNLYTPCVMGTWRCCGALLTGDANSTSPGCGCVLAVVREDGHEPAGKLRALSSKCPRGHW